MNDKMDLTAILQRLAELEAHVAIRNCINRYMEICDALDANTDLNELMDLFDEDSIWEGIGEKYAQSFGHFSSRQAIHDMFKSYTQKESHFVMNAHFVSSEQIYVEDTHAKATWLMLQLECWIGIIYRCRFGLPERMASTNMEMAMIFITTIWAP